MILLVLPTNAKEEVHGAPAFETERAQFINAEVAMKPGLIIITEEGGRRRRKMSMQRLSVSVRPILSWTVVDYCY